MRDILKHKIKLKKNDQVKVIAGSCKGQTGRILKVFPEENKATVEGIQLKKKHSKDGIKTIPGKIDVSNLQFMCPDNQASKIGYRSTDGVKIRFARKTGKNVE